MGRLTNRLADGSIVIERHLNVRDIFSNYMLSSDIAAVRKLAHYEDLDEQGRLVVLPCTVGDTVYEVQQIIRRVQPLEIISVYIGRMGELFFNWELKDGIGIYQNVKGFGLSQLGKTVFLSREEAEAAIGRAEEGEEATP